MAALFERALFFPHFYPALRGAWTIRTISMAASRGYWGDVYHVPSATILIGPSDEGTQSWMSMLPSEIESQEIGLAAAYGHTVVCGLGLGWLPANVALKPEVERVTVLERDLDVIALVESAGVFDQLPADARRKVTVVNADGLTWRPDSPVDTLQADIWRKYIEDRKLADVRTMQSNIRATRLYFWGQEMEIWRYACRRAGMVPAMLDWPMTRHIVDKDIQLPLVLPDWPDFPQKIVSGAPWWTPREDGWWNA